MPAGYLFVDGLELRDLRHGGRHGADFGALQLISHANGNLLKGIEHVELGHDEAVEAVDHSRVAEQGNIEPAATAWASGHGAEFLAALANQLAVGIECFGGKWSAAHARDVGLGYAEHSVDPGW